MARTPDWQREKEGELLDVRVVFAFDPENSSVDFARSADVCRKLMLALLLTNRLFETIYFVGNKRSLIINKSKHWKVRQFVKTRKCKTVSRA